MKKLILLSVAAAGVLSGCSVITSSQPSLNAATGEAWYTKTRVFIIPYSHEIYYCDGKSKSCKQAELD
jgi:hypothetical protein